MVDSVKADVVYLNIPDFLMREKGLASREIVGEMIRYTEKGILVRGHALIEASDTCRRCGKEITNPVSLMVGYGPDCSAYLGIPRDFSEDEIGAIREAAIKNTEIESWFPRRYAFDDTGNLWKPNDDSEVDNEPFDMGISRKNGNFVVSFPFSWDAVEAIKSIPGRKFHSEHKTWQIPVSQADELARVYKSLVGKPAPDTVLAERELMEKRKIESKAESIDPDSIDFSGIKGELYPFQKAGVAYALAAKRTFIGDDPGLGKTAQSLVTAHLANAYPVVVVCPATLKINWSREIRKWIPKVKTEIISGKSPGFKKADIYIINYDILEKHVGALKKKNPKAIIFDEMHLAKNSKAKRSKAAAKIAKGRKYVLGLTGTAILNRPSELIHPLTIMDRLEDMGGFWHFAKRWCNAYRGMFGWDFSGSANLEELNEKLRSICYIRREKSQVLKELPAKRKVIVNLPINNRKEYNRAINDIIDYVVTDAEATKEFRRSIAHLSKKEQAQAWNERVAGIESAEHLVRFNALKKLVALGKMDGVIEWVENFIESGEKLVLFAHHREIVRRLAKQFDAPFIDGGVPLAARQVAVDKFQNDPDCKVIVLNMAAGGVGITLTAASNVAFCELGWTPAIHQQAEDRVHRIGQVSQSVTAWYLLAADTIDEEIAALLDKKQVVTDAVNIGHDAEVSEGILNNLLKGVVAKGKQHD